MAWPPPLPPNTRTESTVQLGNHADDHVLTSEALAEIVNRVGAHRIEFGQTDVTTDAGGEAIVTFASPYPAGSPPAVSCQWLGNTPNIRLAQIKLVTNTQFAIVAQAGLEGGTTAPAVAASSNITLSWIAIGKE